MSDRRFFWNGWSQETRWTVGIVFALVTAIVAVALLYVVVQWLLGRRDIDVSIVNGLLFAFIGLAVLVIVAPTIVRLFEEDLAKDRGLKPERRMKSEDWMTRLRTLITVSLTIVLLVFTLTWFFSPGRLLVSSTPGNAFAGAGNSTTALHPFVRAFVDLYTVVIAFYFPTAAAQSIASTWKGKRDQQDQPSSPDTTAK